MDDRKWWKPFLEQMPSKLDIGSQPDWLGCKYQFIASFDGIHPDIEQHLKEYKDFLDEEGIIGFAIIFGEVRREAIDRGIKTLFNVGFFWDDDDTEMYYQAALDAHLLATLADPKVPEATKDEISRQMLSLQELGDRTHA